MNQEILAGLLLIAAGAFSSASFAIPFSKISGWKWESYWLIYSFGAYILFPFAACLIFAPDFFHFYKDVPGEVLLRVFLLGAVYGIGNLSFGLSLRYLGISLGYAMSLGLMLAIGTLIPPVLDGRLKIMIDSSGGNMLIVGVLIACIGIALTGYAGFLKDRKLSETDKQKSISEFNFLKGLLAAILVGITGSAMSLAFEKGLPVADAAEKSGVDPLFVTMPVMLVLLSGTFLTTIIWCLYLGAKEKSLIDYIRSSTSVILRFNYLFALLAGFLWFIQFILFGMGKSKMGTYTFTSWGILMALTIFFATVWGIYRKEWKGAALKIWMLMITSLLIIIVSAFLIGISGSV
ncbi:MAG TPA: L-rhamnose/proton symporter RhaT [Bacteroidales bacterium]|nr:L-rhamnose/proton symporter RhaT [Bacteroidales bacterium]HPT21565.1 L-rhamnose/proton symporter RhaT [Bacteroidales bacterium]